jgi:hypothetical protein
LRGLRAVLDGFPRCPATQRLLRAHQLAGDEVAIGEKRPAVPRAIRRASTYEPELPAETLLRRAGELFDALALLALDGDLLAAAGALAEQSLRSLHAIH